MKSLSTPEIRKKFVEFFENKQHQYHASAPLVPQDDPTLLFVNAGMVPFKNYFTGQAHAENPRAVSIQKCVRAGGKHNDLENVGFTARHHVFFEMLGNFSFGDYFKKEAIAYAWEFLTQELGIPKDKLYVTCHTSDQEAADIWHNQEGVPRDRIFFLGDKDNFWEMGETGPCGPCSEIFYDHGEDYSDPNADVSDCVLADESRYVEIWNLVFMQFERFKKDGKIEQRDLPNPCVDTGSGLERVAAALQSAYNNFETDGFAPILSAIDRLREKSSREAASKDSDLVTSWKRVVADHIRASTMLLSDGVLPSNEGRGYVLRRIIRRAIRHLDLLGIHDVSFFKLLQPVIDSFEGHYTQLEESREFIERYLKLEEENFRKTLSSGLKLLSAEIQKLKSSNSTVLPGASVFHLYDTHGFPVDLTEMILREQGLTLDEEGFEKHMQEQKDRSKGASDFSASDQNLQPFFALAESKGETVFLGYDQNESTSKVLDVINWSEELDAVVLDKTPFYGESGGQVGDKGTLTTGGHDVPVLNTLKPVPGVFAHIVNKGHALNSGTEVESKIDSRRRRSITFNHTATHLMHAALQKTLGSHVKQAGSYVGPERLRFDFTHPEGLSSEELRTVEKLVNEQIDHATPVGAQIMSKDAAQAKGAMALFGEKYGDEVRVIDIGDFSLELCGGVHVKETSEIRYFKIVSESSLASGVRRIEAVTGQEALKLATAAQEQMASVEKLLEARGDQAINRLQTLLNESAQKSKELQKLKLSLQSQKASGLFNEVDTLANGISFKTASVDEGSDLRNLGDQFAKKHPEGTLLLSAPKGDQRLVLLKTGKGNKNIHCGKILKATLEAFGSRGGGKPDMAQGSVEASKWADFEKAIVDSLASV